MPHQPPARFDALDALPRPFGRLMLLKRIAQGGMGEVFLAASGGIDGAERPCVVKRIRPEHVEDRSFVARFLDEARVQSQLQHPGVAQVLEAATADDGQPYVVVEYVEGRSLAEVRARIGQLGIKLEWSEAVAIGASIAESLAHIHERVDARGKPLGIVHRDLSPQNVMVAFGGDTKLIDFGTARGENRRCHTVSGVVFAKPGYVAPEVANGVPGDHRADLYALGVMLWELVAGRRFLQGDANEHMGAVAANKRALPPIAGSCGAPVELDRILARLTAFSLKDRTATSRSVHRELTQLLVSAPPLPNQERGVRARISNVMATLYPHEPNRSRAEFQKLVTEAKQRTRDTSIESAPERSVPRDAVEGEILPGTRFRIVGKLGQGASGSVFEAIHVDLLRPLAIKILADEHRKDRKAEAQFRREARVLSKISHPNIARFFDYGQTSSGAHYLVMEKIEGSTLDRWHEHHLNLAIAEALRITRQLALALCAVHEAGIVHRDVKPSNVLIGHNGAVKLVDFGVAYTPEESDTDEPELSLYGTQEYMAPEQALGGGVDQKADLYALGCILYELLTDSLPFSAEAAEPILEAKRVRKPEAPSERAPSRKIPAALDSVVLRLLDPNPSMRFDDAKALLEALDDAEHADDPRMRRNRKPARFMVATILAGAMAVSSFAAWASPDSLSEAVAPVAMKVAWWLDGVVHRRERPAQADARRVTPVLEPLVMADTGSTQSGEVEPQPVQPLTDPATRGSTGSAQDTPSSQTPTPSSDEPTRPRESVASLKAKAKKAITRKKWDDARKWAEEWVRAEPSREARLVLGKSLIYSGKQSEGQAVLTALLEIDPSCDDARLLLKQTDSGALPGSAQAHNRSARTQKRTAERLAQFSLLRRRY